MSARVHTAFSSSCARYLRWAACGAHPVCRRFRIVTLGLYESWIRPRANLHAYVQQVQTRPSWEAAFEGASDTWGEGALIRRTMRKIKARS